MKPTSPLFSKILLTLGFFTLLIGTITAQTPAATRSFPFGGLRARGIGPAVMSGRVSDIVGVNSKPEVIYAGAANGGVWKSINAGATFRPVFDEFTQSIGKICIDQKYPDTVWVGTGEPWVRNSVSVGTGIYVTRNGGNSWEFKGLPTSERISNIVIDPTNSKTIYVAVQGALWGNSADRGVYKTTDFGTTWQKILYTDEKTGAADLTIDPNNPNILYASMWTHRRRADYFDSGGEGSALYKTTDAGATWQKIQNGLPAGKLGRIGIGLAPSNPKTLYISVEAEKDKGIYKTTDAGATWRKINSDFNATVRPFYFSRLVVDPTDENKVIKAGLQGMISEDGGVTFRTIQSGVHSDMHMFWFNPKNPKFIILGCDGGAYRSYDGGTAWQQCMDLPLSQFYMVSVDNEVPYNVYGGLQDNNSWFAPSATGSGIGNASWEQIPGGDGFYVFPHPTDNNFVYSESQGGSIVRYDKRNGVMKDIQPQLAGEKKLRYNWNTPLATSVHHPERLYAGAQYLLMTEDKGDTWQKISPDLSTNDPKRQDPKSGGLSPDWSGAETNTTLIAIAESPLDGAMIWVGTDDGNLQLTTDGGKNWQNLTANLPAPKGLWVSFVEPSHYDKNVCYVTIDGHRSGDKKPYIFKTTDAGKTWTALATEGVDAYALCIREDLKNPELLFLGTEFGLFISIDGGGSWRRFTNNLPKTAVPQMVIHPRDNALVIATHGRGAYIIDDLAPLRGMTKAVTDKDFHVFTPNPTVIRFLKGARWFGGVGNFVGENPSSAINITYFQKKRSSFGDLKAELYDMNGKLIKSVPAGKSAGLNVVEIPVEMSYPKVAPTSNIEALGRGFAPPTLSEGSYNAAIIRGPDTFRTQVTITYDPKTPYDAAERAAHQAAALRVYNQTEQLAYYFFQLQTMHEQAEKVNLADKKLQQKITTFATEAKQYKGTLATLDGDFYIAAGEHLREEMSKTYGGIMSYPGKPSAIQLAQLEEHEKDLKKVGEQFEQFKKRMTDLNTQIQKVDAKSVLTIKDFQAFKAVK